MKTSTGLLASLLAFAPVVSLASGPAAHERRGRVVIEDVRSEGDRRDSLEALRAERDAKLLALAQRLELMRRLDQSLRPNILVAWTPSAQTELALQLRRAARASVEEESARARSHLRSLFQQPRVADTATVANEDQATPLFAPLSAPEPERGGTAAAPADPM